MKKYLEYLLIIWLCLGLISCKKFVTEGPSPQLITTSEVFTNDNAAIAAVDGLYTQMRASTPSFANGGLSIYCGLSADEIYNTATNATYDPFYHNAIPTNNGTISNMFWQIPYNIIYRANLILESLAAPNSLTDSVKKQLTGEAKLVRGLTYFYMVNLYGDVPLVITSNYKQSATIGRTPTAEVYQQITSDLKDAQTLLATNYPSSGKLRPDKMVAAALLAKVYLYLKDWTNAETQASQVINSNIYKLVADLNSVFLINSAETIWEIASPNEARNSAEGSTFVPASATVKPAFAITPFLLNAFESGDKRKSSWLKSNIVSGIVYYYPYKFKSRVTTPISEYDIVLRLSELYLIRAEAEAQQGKITEATKDINIVRVRAGLNPLATSLTQIQCLAAVLQERRVELFTEWGNRWFDLKRNGNIDVTLTSEKTGWQPYMSLYPIPYNQIQYNNKLTQNIGYN